MLGLVGVPCLGAAAALALVVQRGVGVVEIVTFCCMYVITTSAITVGFHRHFAHRAFRTSRAFRLLLAVLGSMAVQGPVVYWAANHRRHHRHSDGPGDPHSPHGHGSGLPSRLRGLFHAHVGWLFDHELTDCERWAPDLLRDSGLAWINRTYFVWIGLGLLGPAVLGWALSGTWDGALMGALWGGLVRTFVLQHTTFSINSICHAFGQRWFPTPDRSGNNGWLALLSFGEAWHNNHHACPSSARFGLTWWQVDLGALIIGLLEAAGLVWDVRGPTTQLIRVARGERS